MLTDLQKKVIRTIAKLRDSKSYVAGSAVLNAAHPRISDDLDIFHDDARDVVAIAERDIEALRAAGFEVGEEIRQYGLVETVVRLLGEETLIQWHEETAERFFPLQADSEFGYRLHDADLAVNKVVAASSRRVVRDVVDLVTIEDHYAKLGPLVWAAASSKTTLSPSKMIAGIIHNAVTHSATAYRMARAAEPVDGEKVVDAIRKACEEAEEFCKAAPIDTMGHIFVDDSGNPISPSVAEIKAGSAHPHAISARGAWPSFPRLETSVPGAPPRQR
jgi:hypothetical protein